jgi:hypothetical protein
MEGNLSFLGSTPSGVSMEGTLSFLGLTAHGVSMEGNLSFLGLTPPWSVYGRNFELPGSDTPLHVSLVSGERQLGQRGLSMESTVVQSNAFPCAWTWFVSSEPLTSPPHISTNCMGLS